jgi:hypothetical protein
MERVKGIEPDYPQAQASENKAVTSASNSAYTQIRAQIEKPLDAELSRVAAAWPELSGPLKAAILALVGTVTSVTASKEDAK